MSDLFLFQLPPSEIDPERARDTADQVLSGRAYAEARREPSLQERFFNWMGDIIGDFFEGLSTAGGRGITSWIVIGSFAALIVFLLSRLLKNRGALPVREAASKPVIDVYGGRSADEWLAAALEAEQQQEWRTAVRCRHRALVTTLIRRGVVTARPGQTAGEISRAVSTERPAAAAAMQDATWLFKDTWYGWTEATASSSARFAELADQVLQAEAVPA